MSHAAILFIALLLDAVFGEPRWLWSRLPHPAVVMGRAVGWIDQKFNTPGHTRLKGVLAFGTLTLVAWIIGVAIAALPFGQLFEVIIAAMVLAHRSLVDHVGAVANALRLSLPAARTEVGKIVGRDTSDMDNSAVARGAIESAAENLSDGVVAPAFWFLLLGLPGLLVYKLINTADSMIGYKSPRHRDFGWAAARFDDLANWIPARLTALLIATAHLRPDAWRIIRRDASLHRSPNAGWPESAMAATLDVALAGPRSYAGEQRDFPFVNETGRHDIAAAEIDAAAIALWRTWALMTATAALVAMLTIA